MKTITKKIANKAIIQPRIINDRERATLEFREIEGIAETSYTVARIGLRHAYLHLWVMGRGEQVLN